MALYEAAVGVADPVKFTNTIRAIDQAILRIVPAGVLIGLTVDAIGNVSVGEALIGHVVAVSTPTNITNQLVPNAVNYVTLQMPAVPACVGADGRDIGIITVTVALPSTSNILLLATVQTGSGNPPAIVSVNGSPAGRVNLTLPMTRTTDQEFPSGVVDGVNRQFTLANVPSPASSVALYVNGLRQSAPLNFSVLGAAVMFTAAPAQGSVIVATYRY